MARGGEVGGEGEVKSRIGEGWSWLEERGLNYKVKSFVARPESGVGRPSIGGPGKSLLHKRVSNEGDVWMLLPHLQVERWKPRPIVGRVDI